jgi:antirestriction protein
MNTETILVVVTNPIEEAGHNAEAVNEWRKNHGAENYPLDEWKDWIDQFEEAYVGEMSTEDFATQLAEDMMPKHTPQFLVTYFDYDKFERDLFLGDYWESEGHIFRSI